MWLYGSVARGTDTPISDLDVLVVPHQDVGSLPAVTKEISALPHFERLSITVYSWDQLATMAAYGSLFLVHLRSEARQLYGAGYGSGLRDLVEALPSYARVDHDLWGFAQALADVDDSLRSGGDPNYELGVVATVVRHCSILTTHLEGVAVFDREPSISKAFALVGLRSLTPAMLELHKFRMARLGRVEVAPASVGRALELTRMANIFIQKVKNTYGFA